MFGPGRCVPLDRNAKCRVMMLARALSRRQEKGKAYGEITAKFVAVLQALLWGFHNAASGKCFPSYEAIAEAAACSRTTVYHAIRALEQVGLLSWVNRLVRVREWVPGLFGKGSAWRWRVVRTSNAYVITDPLASEFNSRPGTSVQAKDQTTFAIAEPSDGRRALTNLGITPPDRVPGTSERKRWPITAPDFGDAELKLTRSRGGPEPRRGGLSCRA